MTEAFQRSVGSFIKPQFGSVPANNTGTTVNGASIDRSNFLSCVLHLGTGSVSGAPSAQTADLKLQDSADGTSFLDFAGAAVAQVAADDTDAQVNIDLSDARQFVRTVLVVALTGGTTPAWPVAPVITFGGANELPI